MPKKKTNTAFLKMAQAPLKPSPQLAEVLGSPAPISRPQVAKKVWAYIKP
jgi:chromatin remodeling complex protein RSC6